MEFQIPEWEEPIDEAELDAIEAAATKQFLSCIATRTNPNPNPNPKHHHHHHILLSKRTNPNGDDDDDNSIAKRRNPNNNNNNNSSISAHRRLPNWILGSPSCRERTQVKYPLMTFGGQIVYCRTSSQVEKATVELLRSIQSNQRNGERVSVGFDIEWRPTFRRGETPRKAAVIQLCADNSCCYVMHIIHSGIPPILQSFLEDDSSVKVGVCIANDAVKIFRDYNVQVEALEDLSGLANLKLGGVSKKWSLCSLTQMVTCKELAKPNKIRMGNWEAKVLSREQLHYAATDAFVSWYLYEALKAFPNATTQDKKTDHVADNDLIGQSIGVGSIQKLGHQTTRGTWRIDNQRHVLSSKLRDSLQSDSKSG